MTLRKLAVADCAIEGDRRPDRSPPPVQESLGGDEYGEVVVAKVADVLEEMMHSFTGC